MFAFGPLGTPDNMLLYCDVYDAGQGLLRIAAMAHGTMTARPWLVIVNGFVRGQIYLQPLIEESCLVSKPDTDDYHVALLPLGHTVRHADYWFNNSSRAVLTWSKVKADSYRVYYDEGLGGAVDTLLATIDGRQVFYVTDPLDPGTYVFNVIPVLGGQLAAAVDDASHVDISHTVDDTVGPPTAVEITAIAKPADYEYTIEWEPWIAFGATYEYQMKVGAAPDAINQDDPGEWTPCTSPLVLTVAASEGDLLLIQIRTVLAGEYGYGPILHTYVPAATQLLIPIDNKPALAGIKQSGVDIALETWLNSLANIGTAAIDVRYATAAGGPYTDVPDWATGLAATTRALPNGQTAYIYLKRANLTGLATDALYFVQCRYRSATHITDWSEEAQVYLFDVPALAAPEPDTRGA